MFVQFIKFMKNGIHYLSREPSTHSRLTVQITETEFILKWGKN